MPVERLVENGYNLDIKNPNTKQDFEHMQPEHQYTVAYLDELQAKLDEVRILHAQTATELDALLPSILDNALKGEL